MNAQPFTAPKYPDTNEDHWRIPKSPNAPIVLCDGASESFDSNLWAKILAEGLDRHEDFTKSWLTERIGEYERKIDPEKLSWSKQAAYGRGSFATFLSAQIKEASCLVNAVGDSEIFIIKEGWIADAYPYNAADDFLAHPVLLSTKKELNQIPMDSIDDCPYSGILPIKGASHILMTTDALAHWIMKRRDANDVAAIRFLLDVDEACFKEFVERERKNDLRLDDTTMIRIDLRDYLPAIRKPKLPATLEE